MYYELKVRERLEILSIVEQFVWGIKISREGFSTQNSSVDREACRVNCGANIIISNILPFLEEIKPQAFDSLCVRHPHWNDGPYDAETGDDGRRE